MVYLSIVYLVLIKLRNTLKDKEPGEGIINRPFTRHSVHDVKQGPEPGYTRWMRKRVVVYPMYSGCRHRLYVYILKHA